MTHPLTPREKVAEIVRNGMNRLAASQAGARPVVSASKEADRVTDAILTALASGSGDHAELARLAEAATPGPWEATGTTVWREEAVPIPVTVCCGNGLPSGECCGNGVEDCEWDRTQGEIANAGSNDAAFIAAANPATVLALLAEIAALRASASVIEPELGDLQATNADLSARLTEAERKLAEEEAEVQRWKSAYDITHEQATENGSAANALRGKLAEAVRLLRRIDCIYADMQDGNGNHPTELRKVRTFLSKEAERG
ncbi:ead/Ea22-like family protein [Brevundimonas sp. LF-1]|uniref:ead/Ea22-like family protein n=1 Tax=Brevundimonas sp. LF-1 TaxID=3126100 RepID=UPI0030E5E665